MRIIKALASHWGLVNQLLVVVRVACAAGLFAAAI